VTLARSEPVIPNTEAVPRAGAAFLISGDAALPLGALVLPNPDPDAQIVIAVMRRALRQSGIGVTHQRPDLVYDVVENLPASWPEGNLIGRTDSALPEAYAVPLLRAKRRVLADAKWATLQFAPDLEVTISPDLGDDGVLVGITTVMNDIASRVAGERTAAALVREVNHRSNNLLAIVQAIAAQTGRNSGRVDTFLDRFRGRLHALASAQELITDSRWLGVPFRALAAGQLARAGQKAVDNVRIVGTDPRLLPNAALHIGLALHELIDNALVHGALSSAAVDPITLAASATTGSDGRIAVVIDWSEPDTRAPEPSRPRFGTQVLERIAPMSVGGAADLVFADGQVHYRLHVPAGQFTLAD
jgi:two-component sensor histidine kinase